MNKKNLKDSGKLKYNQKLRRVEWFLAIELPLFSKSMQTRYHLKEFSKWNLMHASVVKFWLLKGALVP